MELGEWRGRGDLGYAIQMWDFALANLDRDDMTVNRSLRCDAVPYLPVAPEAVGGALQHDSLLVDVGCLGGYGSFDLAERRARHGLPIPRMLGVDCDRASVELATAMAKVWDAGGRSVFCQADAAALPLGDRSVAVVVARLVLPYVNIRAALTEWSRVLAGGGLAVVQVHAPTYYRTAFCRSLFNPVRACYYTKAMISGGWLAMTGRQPSRALFSECALSPSQLIRLAAPLGLGTVWEGGFAAKPIVVLKKLEGKK